ncbi:hypothetical protein [Bacillus sp. FJAT-47783]|uniref:hypothetical protein n=1 Tax=Bacillus sp. FJAT-47783 TaxID=2922712 RepID=UPI001FAD101A|nr:hypothetical protein [Bacillus sp. FJAT-47783]
MTEQEGSIGARKFIRLLLLHREIEMEKLTQSLNEVEKQVYWYEIVHDMIQKLTNHDFQFHDLSKDKTPVKLQE